MCDQKYFSDNVQASDAVLCRNNAPLFTYGCLVWNKGLIPVSQSDELAGDKFIGSLCSDIFITQRDRHSTGHGKVHYGTIEIDDLRNYATGEGASHKIVRKMLEDPKNEGVIENLNDFKSILKEEAVNRGVSCGVVHCMTFHKSKGLEFDNVWVIAYDEFKGKIDEQFTEDQMLQERNAEYIAFTRARV